MAEEEYQYRITPKGCMALVLIEELGLDWGDPRLDAIVQKLEDTIFKAGYIYAHESEVRLLED